MKAMEIVVPCQATAVIDALEAAGHEAWCVGGFVRDAIIGKKACDVDIATSALWEQSKDVLAEIGAKIVETGTKHGTITVVYDGLAMEVTTFRTDGEYKDGRRPERVSFVRSAREDLARRDFTMNAIAWHPERGVFDPFGGQEDIAKGLIKAVGNPEKRFQEDALRILRGVRFASQLGFSLDSGTEQAARKLAPLTKSLSSERVFNELDTMIKGRFVRAVLQDYADVIAEALPEIKALDGFEQRNPFHRLDVLGHTSVVVENTPPESTLRWAALLHDAGKPECFSVDEEGIGHFHGHAERSALAARTVAKRLRFPSDLAHDVELLIAHHEDEPPQTRRALRRSVRRLGGKAELFASLCALQAADAAGHAPGKQERAKAAQNAMRLLEEELSEQAVFSRKDLAIRGTDLVKMGLAPGPEVGSALEELLDNVIEERLENESEKLKAYALRNFFHKTLD